MNEIWFVLNDDYTNYEEEEDIYDVLEREWVN